ncbi:FGGY-family carbohydrate kinase [Oscillatoria sp. CS-180]|uniref:FGGY-family carbohydrate kinase n=1 Tax=Oscillatoria sp. CS-180 TaxID=3021720 RepID=UPI00233050BE|nr:FGGY-family carbohydrate kinase [Oscillatoria sp. CS-180]MDB9529221.1 FGGY-family carbohydrate kinase [Oscillatoria sp. CS-180]
MAYFAGLDFGTSGARITVIDASQTIIVEDKAPYASASQLAWDRLWLKALDQLIQNLPEATRAKLKAIAINGTSATVLLCNSVGQPITPPLLYDDDCGEAYREPLTAIAPAGSPVLSATSSLVKLLWWQETLPSSALQQADCLVHQADWLAFQLHGKLRLSDYHNALKLGYDVGQLAYPQWLANLDLPVTLPTVQAPGSLLGYVSRMASERYGLPRTCAVTAGTTDSIAAFLASGARSPGEAVTSLGSTLVIKLLSETRVDDSRYGIYSHRLGNLWLVGGASNTGGAVLKQYFSDEALQKLSSQIPSDRPSQLDYYPLIKPGERFPTNDPDYSPRLTPRPSDPVHFLHGLLEGIARIEAQGYDLLQSLGATAPTVIFTAGGGAQNSAWTALRQRLLPSPIRPAVSTEASFGSACLALEGWLKIQ